MLRNYKPSRPFTLPDRRQLMAAEVAFQEVGVCRKGPASQRLGCFVHKGKRAVSLH